MKKFTNPLLTSIPIGKESYCVRAYAEALEIIPYTLAENAGLHAIAMVTELRNRHAQGELSTGTFFLRFLCP
jgi:chaperonin GroEL (HSP60 family)